MDVCLVSSDQSICATMEVKWRSMSNKSSTQLTDQLLRHIFQYTDWPERFILGQVCTQWRTVLFRWFRDVGVISLNKYHHFGNWLATFSAPPEPSTLRYTWRRAITRLSIFLQQESCSTKMLEILIGSNKLRVQGIIIDRGVPITTLLSALKILNAQRDMFEHLEIQANALSSYSRSDNLALADVITNRLTGLKHLGLADLLNQEIEYLDISKLKKLESIDVSGSELRDPRSKLKSICISNYDEQILTSRGVIDLLQISFSTLQTLQLCDVNLTSSETPYENIFPQLKIFEAKTCQIVSLTIDLSESVLLEKIHFHRIVFRQIIIDFTELKLLQSFHSFDEQCVKFKFSENQNFNLSQLKKIKISSNLSLSVYYLILHSLSLVDNNLNNVKLNKLHELSINCQMLGNQHKLVSRVLPELIENAVFLQRITLNTLLCLKCDLLKTIVNVSDGLKLLSIYGFMDTNMEEFCADLLDLLSTVHSEYNRRRMLTIKVRNWNWNLGERFGISTSKQFIINCNQLKHYFNVTIAK